MIKYYFAIFAILLLFISCNTDNKKNTEESKEEIPTFELAKFEKEAGKYVGKQVKVIGIADHVCKHGGKKLFLVSDDADLHVESDKRFDEKLVGLELLVTGIVREFRVDEAYCIKMEDDNIQSHKKGESDKEFFEQKQEMIQSYRDEMKTTGVDHLSYYSLEYISHQENK